MSDVNIVFAGDRDISVRVLQHILDQGVRPRALLLSDAKRASHAGELRELCRFLPDEAVLVGRAFREPAGCDLLERLQPDYIVCIHFPYIVPPPVLAIPTEGVLNLHPAYLPYNRGWHTPSWAILEGTPVGATLHFMNAGLDTGDIVHQKQLVPSPADTAHTLYARLKDLEFQVFVEAWPSLANRTYRCTPQPVDTGTEHRREDLFTPAVQEIDLDQPQTPRALLRRLRALTTNDLSEAAYFRADGKRYRVQVHITEE